MPQSATGMRSFRDEGDDSVNGDHVFRTVLIFAFLVILPIGLYHRLKTNTREKLDRRQEGLFILVTLRPLGAVFWFSTIAWMINPRWFAWSRMPMPMWVRIAAVGLMATACGLLVWTFRSLGSNLTDTVVTRQEHTMVAHGPYGWIRHPLYTTVALMTAAISLIAANWFLLITGIAVFSLLVVRTRVEEANLVARFGNRYRTYMERTGRFLPRIGASPM
jgi:protein-S-isoprenylcysteine O-methyltransferase Ste14